MIGFFFQTPLSEVTEQTQPNFATCLILRQILKWCPKFGAPSPKNVEAKNCLFWGSLQRYRDLSANIFREKTSYRRREKILTALYESIVFCSVCTMSSVRKFTFAISSSDKFLEAVCDLQRYSQRLLRTSILMRENESTTSSVLSNDRNSQSIATYSSPKTDTLCSAVSLRQLSYLYHC